METNDEKKVRVTFEQPENLTNKYETGEGWLTRKPEAAGQEQETAEAFLKAMKPQVADFDKHDKVAKVFDYYDMTGFAAQYASQQTAALKKQHREEFMRLIRNLCATFQIDIDSLRKQVQEKESLIASVREECEKLADEINRKDKATSEKELEWCSLLEKRNKEIERLKAENEQLKMEHERLKEKEIRGDSNE